jgi:O-antigen/teichoic acid export membrane protein
MTTGGRTDSVRSEKHRFLADVAALTIATYLAQPILFFSNLLTRRWLGPLLIGTYATLTLVQQYALLINLGVLQAADRELPFFRGANDLHRCERIRTATWMVALIGGVVAAAGLAVFALVERTSLRPSLFHGLIVFAPLAVGLQWSATYITFLRTDRRFQFLARANLFVVLCTAIANVVATYLFKFGGLLASTVIVNLVGCVVYTIAAGPVKPRISAAALRDAASLIAIGMPLAILGVAAMGVHTMGSVAVLNLLGTEALGMYTIAISGGSVIHGFANSLGNVIYPRMREEHGRTGSADAILRLTGRPTLIVATALPLLVAPLFFFLPVLVLAVVPKFAPGIPAFRITVIGMALYALAQIAGLCLISLGKTFQLLGWHLLTLLACAGSAMALVGFGLEGVAVAVSVGYLVSFLCVTAHVLSMRETVGSIILMLARTLSPIAYTAALFMSIQYLWRDTPQSFVRGTLEASARMLLFLLAYLPVLVLLEPRARLIQDYVLPGWRRLRGQPVQP